MINKLKNSYKKTNESGVISIITVILLSMVLTLITTAFVKSANSNQRQALDTQLSTQAFYAAESGVNDATSILANGLSEQVLNALNKEECNSFLDLIKSPTYTGLLGSEPDILESYSKIQYTCVLVKNHVSDISLTMGESAIFPIATEDNATITGLEITWGDNTNTVPAGASTELSEKSVWGDGAVALIRLTFYYPDILDRANLASDQKTLFLRPVQSGGNGAPPNYEYQLTAESSKDGSIIGVNCSSSPCTIKLMGISNLITGTVTPFYLRVATVYSNFDSSPVTIKAYDDIGVQKDLVNAQYSIDVTGRANDVYRRIEVRRSIMPDWDFPSSVVNSAGDLCKQFTVWPGSATDESSSGCSF
jgi:hypothetical protein